MQNGKATHAENFSAKLKPQHVQKVLDALGIAWRDHEPSEDGWIAVPDMTWAQSTLGVNINHGGYCDHYWHGVTRGKDYRQDLSFHGDIVDLVRMVIFESLLPEDTSRAMDWIKEVLGWIAPELDEGVRFLNDGLRDTQYTRVPVAVWRSDLSASAKLVWTALAHRCGPDRNYTWIGFDGLANDTKLCRRTVIKAIKDLRAAGWLAEVETGGNRAPKRYPIIKKEAENSNKEDKKKLIRGAEIAL